MKKKKTWIFIIGSLVQYEINSVGIFSLIAYTPLFLAFDRYYKALEIVVNLPHPPTHHSQELKKMVCSELRAEKRIFVVTWQDAA